MIAQAHNEVVPSDAHQIGLRLKRTSAVRQVWRTLEACMYCGASDEDRGEEHIIPASLNGTDVLAKAACRPCRDVTSRFELELGRGTFLVARTRLGMRTRRKSERPKLFPVVFVDAGGRRVSELVPAREVPLSLCFPLFGPPAELDGVPESDLGRRGNLEVRLSRQEDINSFLKSRGAVRAEMQTPIRPTAMARLVAKVAYGYVLADTSIQLRETFVLPLILGHESAPERWVGNLAQDYGRPGRGLHEITVLEVHEHVTVFVRLFAVLGAPEYLVIVGKK